MPPSKAVSWYVASASSTGTARARASPFASSGVEKRRSRDAARTCLAAGVHATARRAATRTRMMPRRPRLVLKASIDPGEGSSMSATHLLVGNPTAQSGKNAARIERARTALREAGVTCDLLPTLPDGATIAAVTRALDDGGYGVVIAMGGDGTFREVASGLLESKRSTGIALGMLPTGTANDQGRS